MVIVFLSIFHDVTFVSTLFFILLQVFKVHVFKFPELYLIQVPITSHVE
ncbi:MAG: hypothetical protein WCG25_05700 [bacterium]